MNWYGLAALAVMAMSALLTLIIVWALMVYVLVTFA